jgi:general secretion pathway protein H
MKYPFRGFTLLEVVLVLVLASVAVGLAVLSLGRLSEQAEVRTALRQVQAALGTARSLAIRERRPVAFRHGQDRFWLELLPEGRPWRRPWRLPQGMRLKGQGPVFFPKGNSTGGALSILGPQGRTYVIRVQKSTGKSRLYPGS